MHPLISRRSCEVPSSSPCALARDPGHPSFVGIAVGNMCTSTEYIPPTRTVSWKGPSTTFLPMWSILLCRCHPVGLARRRRLCRRRIYSARRCRVLLACGVCCPPCSDPMHHASLTPLDALALRAFPSHTMRGPIFTLLNYIFLAMLWLKHYRPPSSSHLDTNPSIRLCYFQSSTATIPFFGISYFGLLRIG
ncbi:hypothetical protein B0H14DRAFT_3872189, partial [Mycena olivaceomarginata]